MTSTTTAATHVHTYTTSGVFTVTLTASGPYNSDTYTRTAYIGVYNAPVASFSGTPRDGTAPLQVDFTNFSLNTTSYLWDFGDGSTSYAENPSHIYLHEGVYTVTLTASNPGGSDTLVRPLYITAYRPPSAGFYATPTQGLVPLTVTLTNISQYADAYLWDYGDGITSTVSATVHTHPYTTTGTFTVSLTASNPYGSDTYTRTAYIGVYNAPVADFSATPLTGMAPMEVSFTNTSVYATDYLWHFGDGESTTDLAPSHTYAASGVYTVSLQALNGGGSDWITRTSYITAHQGPIASFAVTQRIGVGPLTVAFTNTSQYANTFLWDYGDGVTSTIGITSHTHTYTTPGVYTVTLTSSNIHGSNTVTRSGLIAVFASGSTNVYYVDGENGSNLAGDGTQAAPWKTISYALGQMAGTGLELRVASHTYDQGLGETFPIHMKSGISVKGVGYPFTVVTGAASDPVFIFPSTAAFNSTTVLSGFKITGGSAGVRVEGIKGSDATPVIRDNWITGNTHGVHIDTRYGSRAYPFIASNRIETNHQHGLYLVAYRGVAIAQPTIQGNTIANNGGSGVYCYASGAGYPYNGNYGLCNPTLLNNFIADNTGDGVTCHTAYCGGCSPQIIANTIADNGGWGWGRQHDVTYLQSTRPTFVNNFIYGNAAGGAIFVNPVSVYGDRDAPTFINDTIAYNSSYGILDGYATIVNSIVWGHTSDLNAPVSAVSYSDISQGTYVGQNNNISLNPQFVDPDHGDYHVLPTSPVLDAGDSTRPDLPETDFDGDPRFLGAAVDIGADEMSFDIPIAGLVATNDSPTELGEATTLAATITAGSNVVYTWDLGDGNMRSGAEVTHTYPSSNTYTAVVTASNSVSEQVATTTVVVKDLLSLTIIKSGPITATVGAPISYTLHVVNSGNAAVTHLNITDTVPSGASFMQALDGGDLVGDVVLWTLSDLAAGSDASVRFVVTATQTITNSDYGATADGGYVATGSVPVVTSIREGDPVPSLTIPASGGTITPTQGVTISASSGVFSDTVIVHYTAQPITHTDTLSHVGLFYDVGVVNQSTGQPAQPQPGQHYTITVTYQQENVPGGLDEADLALYYWEDTVWIKEPSSMVDVEANTITATPDHFSLWAALAPGTGNGRRVYLPVILR